MLSLPTPSKLRRRWHLFWCRRDLHRANGPGWRRPGSKLSHYKCRDCGKFYDIGCIYD